MPPTVCATDDLMKQCLTPRSHTRRHQWDKHRKRLIAPSNGPRTKRGSTIHRTDTETGPWTTSCRSRTHILRKDETTFNNSNANELAINTFSSSSSSESSDAESAMSHRGREVGGGAGLIYFKTYEDWERFLASRIKNKRTKGLLDLALRTMKLVQRNKVLQIRLAQLQRETQAFVECVLANPENKHLGAGQRSP